MTAPIERINTPEAQNSRERIYQRERLAHRIEFVLVGLALLGAVAVVYFLK